MLRLLFLIISVLFSNTLAKLFFSPNSETLDDGNVVDPNSFDSVNVNVEFVNRGNPLWVLSLSGDDWLSPQLRLGNRAELEDFFDDIAPLIKRKNLRRRRLPIRVKKDDPAKSTNTTQDLPQRSSQEIKKDFIKNINKFALSTNVEPDSYITDNSYEHDGTPSIALFFKGYYTSMSVTLGRRQWHYFINTRSSLPAWFFARHDPRESPILVPEDVKTKLFSSLLSLLHTMFGILV